MLILPDNHWLWQLSMCFLLLSYISPNLLFLRFCLATGSILLVIWSAVILNISVDTLVWNIVFAVINLVHGFYLLYQMRPITFASEDYEIVYRKVFAPPMTPMTRIEFLELSQLSTLVDVKQGTCYVEAGGKNPYLSVLARGTMNAINVIDAKEVVVNEMREYQFVDSPQWMARRLIPELVFPVTLQATRDCRLIVWAQEALEKLTAAKPQFKAYLDGVVGCDVAAKLIEVDYRIRQDGSEKECRLVHGVPEEEVGVGGVDQV